MPCPACAPAILKSNDPEDNEEFLYIEDFDGLAALVQIGVVEIHIWGATVDKIGMPDQFVFDLDPGRRPRRRGRAQGRARIP